MEGRFNLMVLEGGDALDSGRFTRADRHDAPRPDSRRLAEVLIHTDINHQSKGDKRAEKIWNEYKTKHKLTEQKIRDAKMDPENGTDYLMLCFCEACPPSKKAKQRAYEIEKQKHGIRRVLDDGTVVQRDPFPESASDSDDDADDEV